jgi:hypothetical protein
LNALCRTPPTGAWTVPVRTSVTVAAVGLKVVVDDDAELSHAEAATASVTKRGVSPILVNGIG